MDQRLEVTTYFLEIHEPPEPARIEPPQNVEVVAAENLSAEEYLALYHAVGEPWLWYERTELPHQELEVLIRAPQVSIYLLQQAGVTVGFCELYQAATRQTQLLYFGLKPSFIGAGLGRFFLNWTVRQAFAQASRRLWVHTCSLDHPRALPSYKRAGFTQYRSEAGWVTIPGKALVRRDCANARDLGSQAADS